MSKFTQSLDIRYLCEATMHGVQLRVRRSPSRCSCNGFLPPLYIAICMRIVATTCTCRKSHVLLLLHSQSQNSKENKSRLGKQNVTGIQTGTCPNLVLKVSKTYVCLKNYLRLSLLDCWKDDVWKNGLCYNFKLIFAMEISWFVMSR